MAKILEGRIFLVRMIMLGAAFSLVTIGIISIYAIGNPAADADVPGFLATAWKKQLFFTVIALFGLFAINLMDYRYLGPASYWLYGGVLAALALLLVGKAVTIHFPPFISIPVINGTCRWIRIGTESTFLQVQPSEACKLIYIIALAWYLRFRSNYRRFRGLLGPFALTLLAMVLILFEPDLGTVLLMMPVLFCMLFVAGAKVRHLLIIVLMALAVSPFLWTKMNRYQRLRISSVLLQNDWVRDRASESPFVSRLLTGRSSFSEKSWQQGSGWQLKHSKIAIASGGLKGYGYRKGPYITGPFSRYHLPERHNDFIFAAIAHMFGLWGCLTVVLLYAVLIACGVEIAWLNTDPFGRLVTVGIISMFTVEVIVNISMTLGLMPITGLTLPLVSYGGSSLVVSILAVGVLNNIGKYRPFSVAGKAFEFTG